MAPAAYDYQHVHSEPDEETDKRSVRLQQPIQNLKLILRLLLLGVITVAIILVTVRVTRDPLQDQQQECGYSPTQARDAGCVFDIVLMGWVPPRCYNTELASQLTQQAPWVFRQDKNGTLPEVPLQEVLHGEWDVLHVSQAFMLSSCAYSWQKLHLAWQSGGVVDGYTGYWHRTRHCGEMMLMRMAEDDYMIAAANKYVACPWSAGVNKKGLGWYSVVDGKKMFVDDEDHWVVVDFE